MPNPVVLLLILAGGLLLAAVVAPALSRPRNGRRRRPPAQPARDRAQAHGLPRDADPAEEERPREDAGPTPVAPSTPERDAFRTGYRAARRRRRGATVDATRNPTLLRLHEEALGRGAERFADRMHGREQQALKRWHAHLSRSELGRDKVVTTRAEAEQATAAQNAGARPRFGVVSRTGTIAAVSAGVIAFDAFIFDDMLEPLGHSPQKTMMMAIGFGLAIVVLGHLTGITVETGYVQPLQRLRWRRFSQVAAPVLTIGAIAFMVSVAHSRGINTRVATEVKQEAASAQAVPGLTVAGRPGQAAAAPSSATPATTAAPVSTAAPASTAAPTSTASTPASSIDEHRQNFSTTFFSIYQAIAFLAMAALSILFTYDIQAWSRQRRRVRADRARTRAEQRSIAMERATVNSSQVLRGMHAEVNRHAETTLRELRTINLRAEEGGVEAGAEALLTPPVPTLDEVVWHLWPAAIMDFSNIPLPNHDDVRDRTRPPESEPAAAADGEQQEHEQEQEPIDDEPFGEEEPPVEPDLDSEPEPEPQPQATETPVTDPLDNLSDIVSETPVSDERGPLEEQYIVPGERFRPAAGDVAYASPNGAAELLDDDAGDVAR